MQRPCQPHGSDQTNYGLAGQLSTKAKTGSVDHQVIVGAAYDASRVSFTQSTQFGYLNPDRTITPVFGPGAFADGTQDSEDAFDARVNLSSRSSTGSIYATDTMEFNPRTHLTLSGRYNHTSLTNSDNITPGGGPGSLDGDYTFARFNPAAGLTFAANDVVTLYAGANQGSRAPTAIELGCADPASPCKLPNSFSGDPPLKQVVTTTFEAGVRGTVVGTVFWNLGVFRSDNRDDILFVSDNSSGFGYFKNFGKTRRQGVEMACAARRQLDRRRQPEPAGRDLSDHGDDRRLGQQQQLLRRSRLPRHGWDHPDQPGRPHPATAGAQHQALRKDWEPNAYRRVGADMNAVSGTTVRGNENGLHTPDGVYYTGSGQSGGYAVFNLGVDYKPKPGMKFFMQITNLFDRKYTTGGQLGINGFTVNGAYIARRCRDPMATFRSVARPSCRPVRRALPGSGCATPSGRERGLGFRRLAVLMLTTSAVDWRSLFLMNIDQNNGNSLGRESGRGPIGKAAKLLPCWCRCL